MRIGVLGAGAIGCYVGGRLLAAGNDVVLLGRPSLAEELRTHGLTLSGVGEADAYVPADAVRVATEPSALADCDVVLVTLKGLDTASAAKDLAEVVRDGTLVVSLQNGIRNADVLRQALPRARVLGGMVPFNVVRKSGGRFHRGTTGPLYVASPGDDSERAIAEAFRRARLPVVRSNKLERILWGKLLFNLNNATNALSGLPLRTQIGDRRFRRAFSAAMREGLAVLKRAHIKPASFGPIPSRAVPFFLKLPDAVFFVAARAQLAIDPEARSSMWDDLERKRKTEIDLINGEVVRLGREVGVPTPVNETLIALVRKAEEARQGSPKMSGDAILAAIGLA